MARQASCAAKSGRAFCTRIAAERDFASSKEGLGAPDAFGPHGNIQLRRKSRDDIFRTGFSDERPAVARERPALSCVRRRGNVSTYTPKRVRSDGDTPP